MINKKYLTIFALTFLLGLNVYSQKSLVFHQSEITYDKAMELFKLNKFGSARDQFDVIIKNSVQGESNLYSEASYYQALCAKKLENDDASYLFEKFIIDFPENNKKSYAYFHLGDMKLSRKKYKKALRDFENVEEQKIKDEDIKEFKFKKGYCHFMEEENDVASRYFNSLKDVDSKYYEASNYYYAHIQYQKGNYQTALDGFERLANEKTFKKIVPFYISQIYYLKEDYDAAIKYALPLLDEGSRKRKADMARIVGESYFAKKDYLKSVEYFETTIDLTDSPRREDYYHMGFAYYYQNKYDKAAEFLSMVTSANDKMAQNAYYHLADCHLKLGDKKRARVAFEAASKNDFDKDIQEDALFNTLKLNYELNYSPFNELITSFLSFIEKFPESDKIDLAYDYLGKVFLTTKNYSQALEALENIKLKNKRVYQALQKVSYYHAIDLFTNLHFNDAVKYFNYSLKYGEYDNDLKVKAYYWKGEAKYRLGKYSEAQKDYNTFILTNGSFTTGYFPIAHYNIGYAEFKAKDYESAKSWWRKYINLEKDKKVSTIGDAYNRIGDCYFVGRDFAQAIKFYDKGSLVKTGSPDYSMYQKAISHGIQKQHQVKIDELNALIKNYPKSNYVDDALYEMGKSYVALGDLRSAIFKYKTIKEKYPSSSFSKKAMLQLGLVYYNSNDYDNSMAFYKRVVNEYPSSQESIESLLGIRNIYMERNDLDGYVAYTKTLGSFAQVDVREQDSLSYVGAERFYMESKCDAAIMSFNSYLKRYPTGMFMLNANYYLADCLYKKGEKYDALRAYNKVTSQSKNIFTEEALIRSGEINFGLKNYQATLSAFEKLKEVAEIAENRLEAKIGLLRCHNKLNNNDEVIIAADNIINSPKVDGEIIREAKYFKAGALRNKGEVDLAITEYTELAKNTQSVEGAESKYYIAQNYYNKGDKVKAENEVFDFANKGTSHQYWLARSFILLAEIYESNKEYFQAKQYLQSIIENYKGEDDINQRVQERLKSLESKIKVSSKSDTVDTLKIQ